tara:strand:+ start:1060 stop:1425 length:366 start_codon:yes stop_codon:yes gene_type:complete
MKISKTNWEVHYEWCWEYSDEHGDIIHAYHADTLKNLGAAEASHWETGEPWKPELTLIRDHGNDADGLQERSYAYPTNGTMPELFSCGSKIPKRFQKEFNASPLRNVVNQPPLTEKAKEAS